MNDVETILDDQDQGPSAKEAREEESRHARRELERETIASLAALEPGGEYERARRQIAKKLGWRTTAVDVAVKAARETKAVGKSVDLTLPEPWPEPVSGAPLLHALIELFRSFVILPPHAAEALALWVLFAHSIDYFDVAPRLAILSAVMRSGKTTLLRIVSWLVPRALLASNISPAAIYRVLELAHPTLLVDEADSFARRNEELRGILNSGHDREAAFVVRCDGDDNTPRRFSTWGAIAIAAIGKLPPTWIDRSIVINLKRRLPSETVQRINRSCRAGFEELARKCARWTVDNADRLKQGEPAVPQGLNDRAAQNWLPLVAIADAAGGEFPELARKAAVALSGGESAVEASLGVMLLSDIRTVLDQSDRISSANICEALATMEGRPWPEYGRSLKPISQNQLARILEPFGIAPHTIRFGAETAKGYLLKDFSDAFDRYLPSVTPSQSNGENEPEHPAIRNKSAGVTDGNTHFDHGENNCDGVAVRNGAVGQ